MIVLFFADVIGRPAREMLGARLPQLKERYGADFVIVNGENAANGVGITPKVADRLLGAGVDVITTGNHIWKYKEIYEYIEVTPRLLRPFNLHPGSPGRGLTVVNSGERRLGVINLLGSLYLDPARSPFDAIDEALEQLCGVRNIVVDLHAEATSEKVALGHYLDGRVSAVLGTHTHVRTGDAGILPGGTAYMTDVGMCGSRDSVIGVKKEKILQRFLTQMPVTFDVAEHEVWLEGVALELDDRGRALRITPFEEGPGG